MPDMIDVVATHMRPVDIWGALQGSVIMGVPMVVYLVGWWLLFIRGKG